MKFYSGSGDDGKTYLPVKASRVSKDEKIFNAIGSIDELQSWIGFLGSMLQSDFSEVKQQLINIQKFLYRLLSYFSTNGNVNFGNEFTKKIENYIEALSKCVPELNGFILPGGCKEASVSHVIRAICRRVEREIISFRKDNGWVNNNVVSFINRLSSYFFVLALYFNKKKGIDEKYAKQ